MLSGTMPHSSKSDAYRRNFQLLTQKLFWGTSLAPIQHPSTLQTANFMSLSVTFKTYAVQGLWQQNLTQRKFSGCPAQNISCI